MREVEKSEGNYMSRERSGTETETEQRGTQKTNKRSDEIQERKKAKKKSFFIHKVFMLLLLLLLLLLL